MKNYNLTKSINALIILFIVLSLNACYFKNIKGNGHVTTEDRSVSDFSKIQVSSAISVIYTQDPTYSIKVKADDNLIKYITTEVHGSELRIGIKKGKSFRKVTELVVYVSAASIDKIELSGASTFTSTNSINANNLNFMLSGASALTINGSFNSLIGELSGASHTTISGTSSLCNFEGSGASNYHTSALTTGSAIVNLSGASICSLTITTSLSANLSGASVVNYSGNPSITSDLSGSSSINKN